MSAMPSNLPAIGQTTQDDLDQSAENPRETLARNAARTDAAVQVNRATTGQDVLANARRVRRLSMEELNRRDAADLERMMDEIDYDPRGPVTKVLDVLDLPRNAIANLVAPGIAARKRAEGDKGTFGLGKVTFSDYLSELGMRPGLARAAIGLAGDIVTDPLTYLGPGAITKIAGTTAARAGVQTTRAGVKALEGARGVLAAGKGIEGIADPAVKALYQAFHGGTDAATAATKAGELSETFLGKIAGTNKQSGLGKTAKSVLGFDVDRGGSVLADYAARPLAGATPEEAAKIKAVQDFVGKYGKAAPGKGTRLDAVRGLSIGDGGSQIAHVPFTNFGINVPAFTGPGYQAVKAASIAAAQAGDARPLMESIGIESDLAKMAALETSGLPDAGEQAAGIAQGIRNRVRTTLASPGSQALTPDDVRVLGAVADKADAYARMVASNRDLDPLKKFIGDQLVKGGAKRDTLLDPKTYAPLRDEAQAAMQFATQQGSTKQAKEIVGPLGEYLLNTDAADLPTRLAEADAWLRRVEAAHDWSQAANASLHDVLNTTTDIAMQEWAKDFLRLSDEAVGGHVFAPFYKVAQSLDRNGNPLPLSALERSGAGIRKTFGNRGNAYNDIRRMVDAQVRMGADHSALEFLDDSVRQMQDMGRKYRLSPTDEEAVTAAMHGILYDRLNTKGQFYATEFGTGKPSRFMQAINNAKPIFDANPELRADVDKLVASLMDKTNQLGEQAVALGLVDNLRDAYAPTVMSREGREMLAQARRNATSSMGAASTGKTGEILEAFQKPRTSDQYRFTDTAGKERQVFEWDFMRADIAQSELDKIPDGPIKDEILQSIDDVNEFNKVYGNPSEKARRAIARQTDPMELNDLLKSGRLSGLVAGAATPGGVFIENPIAAMLMRSRAQFAASARKAGRELLDDGAIYASTKIVQHTSEKAGATITLDNGLTAKVVKAPGGQSYIRVGGEPYRQLDPSIINPETLSRIDNGSVLSGVLSDQGLTAYYPVKKAEFIERIAKIDTDDALNNQFLKTVDTITKSWKSLTLLHPSWTIGNIIGAVYQSMSIGADPIRIIKYFPKALKGVYHELNPAAVEHIMVKTRGGEASLANFLIDTEKQGVRNVNRGSDMIMNMFPDGTTPGLLNQTNPFTKIKDRVAKRVAYNYERIAAQRGADSLNFADKAKAWVSAGKDEAFFRRIMAPWAQVNAKLEDTFRLATYMALIDQGESAASAARKVVEGMFDMTDMTDVERSVRRYLMPFYTWLRNSGTYGVKLMLTDPKKVAIVPRLKDTIEEALNGEETVPDYMRPSWMREQLAIQLGRDPNSRYSFTIGSMIPTETATQLLTPLAAGGQGFGNVAKYALSSLNPLAQVGIALGTGQEPYTGRKIGFNPYEGDIHVLDFLASQARPVRELVPLGLRGSPLLNAAEKGPGQLAARVFLGGRAQPFDEQRLAYGRAKDIRDKAEQLRSYINLAEREGKADASLKARAELLALYRDAIARGMADEVPAWAKKMLNQDGSSQ